MKPLKFSCLAMLVAPLTACTSTTETSGGDAVAVEDYTVEYNQTLYDKAQMCCGDGELENPPDPGTMSQSARNAIAAWQAKIEAGTLAYDEGKARGNLSAIRELPCAEFALLFSDPTRLYASQVVPFEGLVPNGETCQDALECASGYCDDTDACAARLAAGDDCSTAFCADGLYCAQPADPSDPEATYTCAPKQADGMDCFNGHQCANGACNGGDPNNGVPGMCGAPTICDGR